MKSSDRTILLSFGFHPPRRSQLVRNLLATLFSGILLLGLVSLYQWFSRAEAVSPDIPLPVPPMISLKVPALLETGVVVEEIEDPIYFIGYVQPPVKPMLRQQAEQQQTSATQPPPAQPPPPNPQQPPAGETKPQEQPQGEQKGPPAHRVEQLPEPFQRALFYQKSGDWQRAIQEYLNLLEKDPLNFQAHDNLGLIYQDLQRYGEAADQHRKAILLKSDYVPAYNNLGVALLQDGKIDQASKVFKEGLAIDSKDPGLHTNLGLAYKKQTESGLAERSFLNALELSPNHPEAHYNLALLYEDAGELQKAVKHYQAFLLGADERYEYLSAEVRRHLKEITPQ